MTVQECQVVIKNDFVHTLYRCYRHAYSKYILSYIITISLFLKSILWNHFTSFINNLSHHAIYKTLKEYIALAVGIVTYFSFLFCLPVFSIKIVCTSNIWLIKFKNKKEKCAPQLISVRHGWNSFPSWILILGLLSLLILLITWAQMYTW